MLQHLKFYLFLERFLVFNLKNFKSYGLVMPHHNPNLAQFGRLSWRFVGPMLGGFLSPERETDVIVLLPLRRRNASLIMVGSVSMQLTEQSSCVAFPSSFVLCWGVWFDPIFCSLEAATSPCRGRRNKALAAEFPRIKDNCSGERSMILAMNFSLQNYSVDHLFII